METEAMEAKTVTLAGRQFQPVGQKITAAQDNYITGHLRLAGVLELLMKPDKSIEKDSEEIFTRLLVSGAAEHLAAGMLIEVGKSKWRLHDAEQNAEDFADITDAKERRTLQGLLLGLVGGFFQLGGKSLPTSPSSSANPQRTGPDGESGAAATSETLA